MATDAPNGLVPFGHLIGGATAELSQVKYSIAAGYGTKLHRGTPVSVNADGTLVVTPDNGNNFMLGAFFGCRYVTPGGEQVFSPYWDGDGTGRTEIEAMVYDDPFIIYRIQADGSLTFASGFGENAAFESSTGNDRTGTSNYELDSSGAASTATFPLRILGKVNVPDNDWGDTNVDLLVKLNLSALTNTTGQ